MRQGPEPPAFEPDTGEAAGQYAARSRALRALNARGISYAVAGAYAMRELTGIFRDTKDLDLCLKREEVSGALEALASAGFRTERVDPVWLAKAFAPDGEYVDLIFNAGNGVVPVDERWMKRSRPATVLGVPARITAPEDLIWSKVFVLERDRFDGADIAHLIRSCGPSLDWRYLAERMKDFPELLLTHLLLFRFSFPGERDKVPAWLLHQLFEQSLRPARPAELKLCRGTLLSRWQYDVDLARGYRDSRMVEVEGYRDYVGRDD